MIPLSEFLLWMLLGLLVLGVVIWLLKATVPALDRPAKHQGTGRRRRREPRPKA